VDVHRELRALEAVLAEEKTPEQVAAITKAMLDRGRAADTRRCHKHSE
jgi:NCAIR mutase (PurE)-related protein